MSAPSHRAKAPVGRIGETDPLPNMNVQSNPNDFRTRRAVAGDGDLDAAKWDAIEVKKGLPP